MFKNFPLVISLAEKYKILLATDGSLRKKNKGLWQAQHDKTAACPQCLPPAPVLLLLSLT